MQKPVNLGNLDNPQDIARLAHYLKDLYSMTVQVRTGTGAPNFTPTRIGDEYIDTSVTPNKYYKSVGTLHSTQWVVLN